MVESASFGYVSMSADEPRGKDSATSADHGHLGHVATFLARVGLKASTVVVEATTPNMVRVG